MAKQLGNSERDDLGVKGNSSQPVCVALPTHDQVSFRQMPHLPCLVITARNLDKPITIVHSLTMESGSKLSSWCMGVICTADPRAGVSSTPDPTLLVTHHAASGKALNAASIKPCQAHDGRGFAGNGEHVVGWMQSCAMCAAISAGAWTGWQLVALTGTSKDISRISHLSIC